MLLKAHLFCFPLIENFTSVRAEKELKSEIRKLVVEFEYVATYPRTELDKIRKEKIEREKEKEKILSVFTKLGIAKPFVF